MLIKICIRYYIKLYTSCTITQQMTHTKICCLVYGVLLPRKLFGLWSSPSWETVWFRSSPSWETVCFMEFSSWETVWFRSSPSWETVWFIEFSFLGNRLVYGVHPPGKLFALWSSPSWETVWFIEFSFLGNRLVYGVLPPGKLLTSPSRL